MWRNKTKPTTTKKKNKNSSVTGDSVDFHCSVDFPDEHVGCIEANRACQQPERQDHQGRIAKVQEGGDELHNVQLETNTEKRNLFLMRCPS